MKKLAISLAVAASLLVPCATFADDHDHDRDHDQRYYDRHRKDYHHWDDREDRAYHMYWEQRHRPYVDWDHANNRDRERYWNWRHEHNDSLLKIDIR